MDPNSNAIDFPAIGIGLSGLGALAGEGAWLHMLALQAQFGAICGAAVTPHCILCATSAALVAAGLACLAASVASRRAVLA